MAPGGLPVPPVAVLTGEKLSALLMLTQVTEEMLSDRKQFDNPKLAALLGAITGRQVPQKQATKPKMVPALVQAKAEAAKAASASFGCWYLVDAGNQEAPHSSAMAISTALQKLQLDGHITPEAILAKLQGAPPQFEGGKINLRDCFEDLVQQAQSLKLARQVADEEAKMKEAEATTKQPASVPNISLDDHARICHVLVLPEMAPAVSRLALGKGAASRQELDQMMPRSLTRSRTSS